MQKTPVKPLRSFRCPYCGYTFVSADYTEICNRFTAMRELEEDCIVCGCVIRIKE